MDGSGTAFYQPVVIENNGVLIFQKGVQFGGGQICTMNSENVFSVHSNTKFMGEYHIVAEGRIDVGSGCAVSWNTQIMDTDIHDLLDGEITVNKHKDVVIGNHVWIASYVDILKGTEIKDNSVIAYRSCVLSKFDKSNCIIGGYSAKILRENINWEK